MRAAVPLLTDADCRDDATSSSSRHELPTPVYPADAPTPPHRARVGLIRAGLL